MLMALTEPPVMYYLAVSGDDDYNNEADMRGKYASSYEINVC